MAALTVTKPISSLAMLPGDVVFIDPEEPHPLAVWRPLEANPRIIKSLETALDGGRLEPTEGVDAYAVYALLSKLASGEAVPLPLWHEVLAALLRMEREVLPKEPSRHRLRKPDQP